MTVSAWEAIFMLVVLKIPVIYLATVVWWAVRAVPEAPGGGETVSVLAPLTPCGWDDWKRRRPRRPGRGPLGPVGAMSMRRRHAVCARLASQPSWSHAR